MYGVGGLEIVIRWRSSTDAPACVFARKGGISFVTLSSWWFVMRTGPVSVTACYSGVKLRFTRWDWTA